MKKQKGGKKLDSGASGCIITPPITCGINKKIGDISSLKYVSKLISEDIESYGQENIKFEFEVYKILQKIDPSQQNYIYPIDYCFLNKKSNISRHDIKNIKFVKSPYKNDEYNYDFYIDENKQIHKISSHRKICFIDINLKPLNIIFPYGGNSISDIFHKKKFSSYKSYYKEYFQLIFYKLLFALYKLHSNNIIHGDIKLENIVSNNPIKYESSWIYNPHDIRFIDFGMSYQVNKYYKQNIYHSQGTIIPLDIFLAKYIKNNEYSNIIDNKIKELTKDFEFIKDIWNIDNIKLIQHIFHKLKNIIINHEYIDEYKNKITGIIYKADVYSLGIAFAIYISDLNIHIENDMRDLLFNMVNIDPWKRYNVMQCLNHSFFDKIPAQYKIIDF